MSETPGRSFETQLGEFGDHYFNALLEDCQCRQEEPSFPLISSIDRLLATALPGTDRLNLRNRIIDRPPVMDTGPRLVRPISLYDRIAIGIDVAVVTHDASVLTVSERVAFIIVTDSYLRAADPRFTYYPDSRKKPVMAYREALVVEHHDRLALGAVRLFEAAGANPMYHQRAADVITACADSDVIEAELAQHLIEQLPSK